MSQKTYHNQRREQAERADCFIANHGMVQVSWNNNMLVPAHALRDTADPEKMFGLEPDQKPKNKKEKEKESEGQQAVESKLRIAASKRTIQLFSEDGIERLKKDTKIADSDVRGRLEKAYAATRMGFRCSDVQFTITF